ncbi:site-specific integrase [endosymbiont GvMRE of Glomus versiforme]|uniref:site-specific integrase n=1 Tax=endosymbiont GvMRE of Glomus versiforme TaxID=2039283 RepID=UPI000EC2B728|nr:site-specific integrase [endosymbiont GvMRE of Glomus versiforme]RHZ36431.1 Tyrosine recombinase XerD [endosymbiont GvMRE of Glomus versiforme]
MLPNLTLLEQINHKIKNTPNRQGEYKKPTHYGLFLLCHQAGLRVSEAINFNLASKNKQGLYQIKSKGNKKRYVYISPQIINELKVNNWKSNSTNRFNFYHFLKSIKQKVNLPANTELTPHILCCAFATFLIIATIV